MKDDRTAVQHCSRFVVAVFAGLVLMAGTGCNCININVGTPQAGTGIWTPPPPPSVAPPSGGNFTPVQSYVSGTSGTAMLCGQQITKKRANFYPPSQTPNPGENAFRGYVLNGATGQVIPNTDYVLQAIVNISTFVCGTPVAGSTTDVSFPATAGTSYKIAAHFKPNKVPPNNPPITLHGAWIIQ
jgi:hypothetical protein